MNRTNVWTAVITPFMENGEIDFFSFKNLLLMQESAGVGVVLLGSTGEGLNLSTAKKRAILKFAAELKLKIPLMVGLSGHDEENNLAFIRENNNGPWYGYLAVCPIYAKPGVIGQTLWYEKILETAAHPVMLYNVPSRSGVKLAPQVLTNLSGHKNLWALKEASGNIEDTRKYFAANHRVELYSGEDSMMFDYMNSQLPIKGLVSVASNAWPLQTKKHVDMALAKTLDKASAHQFASAAETLFLAANPVPVKRLLFEMGIIQTPKLLPPLHHGDLSAEMLNQILIKNQGMK